MLRAAVALQKHKADLSLAWKASAICVKPSNTKPFNCWSLPVANLTKKPCADGSINNAIISLLFTDHDGVDATNNLAERQLRPAVIARKISCGNKTQKGARTWQILASIAATCAQRATSFIAEITRAAPLQAR
jgi:hypothetical protein